MYCIFALQIENAEIVCHVCGKTCKSKGGLKRHKTTKHPQSLADEVARTGEVPVVPSFQLDGLLLQNAVEAARKKIVENPVYAKYIKDDLAAYVYTPMDEESENYKVIAEMVSSFSKKRDLDKFYQRFYTAIPCKAEQCFPGLSNHAATLLSMKLADQLLGQVKEGGTSPSPISPPKQPDISEKEKAGLQCIGGYVFHKLHQKHRSGKKWQSKESQCTMAVLKEGKCSNEEVDRNRLTSALSRGGLWGINKDAESIFLKTEINFRKFCPSFSSRKIDMDLIIAETMHDCTVKQAFDALVNNLDTIPESTLLKDILFSIISLYVKVRCFSFARDIIQRFKIEAKKGKSKGLRAEIKRASDKAV